MISRPYRLLLCTVPLLVAGLLGLAFVDHRRTEHLMLGYIFGTIFAHTTLAAAWTVFGPLPLRSRLLLSLLWLVLLTISFTINVSADGGPDGGIVVTLFACMIGQWLFVQIPLWGLALGYGLQLGDRTAVERAPNPRDLQFGIRELMIFTAIVGVCFGLGRAAVVYLVPRLIAGSGGGIASYIFLVVAAIVLTLPLLLAAFLRRFSLPAVAIVLVLIGLATAWELPLLNRFHRGPGPDMFHLIFINTFTALWILLITQVVRLNGYRLVSAARESERLASQT